MSRVAVIGLGSSGLASVKNLIEAGFEVTGFDKHGYVGGIWHFSQFGELSTLESTIVNTSKERTCYTDFPFDDDSSSYPTAAQVDDYLNKYADRFNLRPNLRLNTTVSNVQRDHEKGNWILATTDRLGNQAKWQFDKVIVAVGPDQCPRIPSLHGEDLFSGTIIHCIDFKEPSAFQNQRVLVVGIGNSACDTATALAGVAKEVYIPHRGGCLLLPRIQKNGKALDHTATWRTFALRDYLEKVAPAWAAQFADNFLGKVTKDKWELDPAWKIDPAPSVQYKLPTISDNLVQGLSSGKITSVDGPERFVGGSSVELTSGQTVEVDAVIYCTGYRIDLSLLGCYDPTTSNHKNGTTQSPPESVQHDYDLPKLYQNILSLEFPDSLAVIGAARTIQPANLVADLASMAVAQLWKFPHRIPSREVMEQWYADHSSWAQDLRNKGGYVSKQVRVESWMSFVEEAARTRVAEHLGYGLTGWLFWWQNRELCKLMMDGLYSPHFFRLFTSDGRRPWPDAEAAIQKVNKTIEERTKSGTLLFSKIN